MDHPPRNQTPRRSPPLQTRAFHFLRNLALRARRGDRKLIDAVSPVAIPTQDRQRARSSVDLLRKPDITQFIGFRAEDGTSPMDTDDSSQDASASGNSPRVRPRRYSAFDSLPTAPIHPASAGHVAEPLFCRDQVALPNKLLIDNPVSPVNMPAPASLFLRSDTSLDAVAAQPSRSSMSSPVTPPQISVPPKSKSDGEAAQDILKDDTQRLAQDDFHSATLAFPSTDLTSSTSSDPNIPKTQPVSVSEASTSQTVLNRPTMLSHHSAPSPPPFRVATERGLRLSPSIITRQPMPLLNLPTLPPPPPRSEAPPRPKVPLRSIPSLSRHGPSDADCQVDHEDVTPGDSEEEDGDEGDEAEEFTDALCVHQSDDEEDESEPPSAGPESGTQGFKSSQKQPMKGGQLTIEYSVSPPPQDDVVSPNPTDSVYSKTFVKSVQPSASLTVRPYSPNIPHTDGPLDPGPLKSGARLEVKPSLYRVASRSLDNLGSTRRSELELRPLRSRETVRSNPASVAGRTIDMHVESEESDTEAMVGRLLRRTSMPSFPLSSDPPPYPAFNPRSKESRVTSQEDEGRERLPPYSNSLHLIAILPRKMEFNSPGVQAKDRKWRRVVCELEGTALRIYKCPRGASGAGVLGDWWEKRMGVGNLASSNSPRTRKKDDQVERPTKLGIEEHQAPVTPSASLGQITFPVDEIRRRSESQSSMAASPATTSTPRPAKRISGASFFSPFRSSSSHRPEASVGESSHSRPESGELEVVPVDVQDNHSSFSHESAGGATSGAQRLSQPPQPRSASRLSFLPVATGRMQWRSGEVPKPPKSDLLRAYTLQHAESGLGNDYLKRKNVIRLRLEGEQFLLQAPDIPAVVEWIEGLHAGTNIALDLDQRPMPKGPMFPRRRRRRPRRIQEDTSSDRAPHTAER